MKLSFKLQSTDGNLVPRAFLGSPGNEVGPTVATFKFCYFQHYFLYYGNIHVTNSYCLKYFEN